MDIKLRPSGSDYFSADLVLDDGDLALDDGFNTAVLISLFSDRRAEPGDDLPDPAGGRRGWWGDALNDFSDLIGSRLWLLNRAKATPETRKRCEEYIREALAWMIEDGVALRLDVSAYWQSMGTLVAEVSIERPGGERHKFDLSWRAQAGRLEYIGEIITWAL